MSAFRFCSDPYNVADIADIAVLENDHTHTKYFDVFPEANSMQTFKINFFLQVRFQFCTVSWFVLDDNIG